MVKKIFDQINNPVPAPRVKFLIPPPRLQPRAGNTTEKIKIKVKPKSRKERVDNQSNDKNKNIEDKTKIKVKPKARKGIVDNQSNDKTKVPLVRDGNRVNVSKTAGNLKFDLTMVEIGKKLSTLFFDLLMIKILNTVKLLQIKLLLLEVKILLFLEIENYIHECKQKQINLDNEDIWSKAYLPATRTYEGTAEHQANIRTSS